MVSRGRSVPKAQKKTIGLNPHLELLRKHVAGSPTEPGIYRWMDAKGNVMYIGKAKNLRKRLTSYVNPKRGSVEGPWKQSFLLQIASFDVTVCNTELEALILETNLIKELRPKYNVLMKDDKNHLFIRITIRDPYPSVEMIRRFNQDGAKYFGPFLGTYEVKQKLDLAQEALHYRACKASLETLNGRSHQPLKACLDSQIGLCNGLCTGTITLEEYQRRIGTLIEFLKGRTDPVRDALKERMAKAAADKKFEIAAKLRNFLSVLEGKQQEQQLASDTTGEDSDIFGVAVLSNRAHVVVMLRRNGKLIGESHYELAGQAESVEEVLEQFLPQFYQDGVDIPSQVFVSDDFPGRKTVELWLRGKKEAKVEILVPERGRKSHLLQLAEKNAREKARLHEMKWEAERANTEAALQGLQSILELPTLPHRIEGYDISHTGGTETVGSMVVTKHGKAANDQYRSFTIRTLKSGDVDDYRALKETLRRRLRYLAESKVNEEKEWKKKGISFGKARKAEQKAIDEIHAKHKDDLSDKGVDYKEYLVARLGDAVIGFGKLAKTKEGITELRSILVTDEWRGQKLGQFIARLLLRRMKKGKVYVSCDSALEQYYGELGFRYVIKPPKAIVDAMEEFRKTHPHPETVETFVMMWEAHEHKEDPSLTARPDLIVVDGGKGQLSAATEVLSEFDLQLPAIGLAKREEEIFVPNRSDPVLFPKDAQAKFLLMRLRDEAHRFANRLREKKAKLKSTLSALDQIPGIGETTRKELLKKFGTVSGVKEASDNQLLEVLTQGQLEMLRKAL